MNKKTKERSRTLASTLTLKEGPVDKMEGMGTGGGGGGASSLGGVTGSDKNKEEYKSGGGPRLPKVTAPDRPATPRELARVAKPTEAPMKDAGDFHDYYGNDRFMGKGYHEHMQNKYIKENLEKAVDAETGSFYERMFGRSVKSGRQHLEQIKQGIDPWKKK